MTDGGRGAGEPDGFDVDNWFARAFGAPEPPPVDPSIEGAPHGHEALPPTEAMPFETAHLAEVSPDAADAPGFEPPPTQAMDVADLPTELRPGPASAIERVPVAPPPGDGDPPDGLSRTQKILLGVGGSLLALLSLAALFLLGTRLPDLLGPAPAAVTTPSPTPTPSPITELPLGPVPPGSYEWDELLGGECLDPFVDPWQEQFTVVDCAQPHPAQLLDRSLFAESPDGAYPGVEALQAQLPILCSAPGVVDLAAAGQYTDVVIQGSFPVTEEQWALDRSYYCFASRSTGEPLSGSIAVPAAPVG